MQKKLCIVHAWGPKAGHRSAGAPRTLLGAPVCLSTRNRAPTHCKTRGRRHLQWADDLTTASRQSTAVEFDVPKKSGHWSSLRGLAFLLIRGSREGLCELVCESKARERGLASTRQDAWAALRNYFVSRKRVGLAELPRSVVGHRVQLLRSMFLVPSWLSQQQGVHKKSGHYIETRGGVAEQLPK